MGTNLPGSVRPNSAIVGADIKNDYSYDRDIKGNKNPPAVDNGESGSGSGSGIGSGSGSGNRNNSNSNGAGLGGKKPNYSFNGTVGGSTGGNASASNPSTTPTPIQPDTTVQDNYKAAMEAANDRLKQAFEYQQGQLANARDNALREAYIKQQMVERRYPEQLSAAGINGGAAQGLLARNNADYANQRTAIHGNYINSLGEAGQAYQQGIMKNNEDFLNTMAAYQQSLDEMRRQWELEQLEKSGLFKASLNKNNVQENSSGGKLNFKGKSQPLTAQDYLNNLRNNYGNLFR